MRGERFERLPGHRAAGGDPVGRVAEGDTGGLTEEFDIIERGTQLE
jgi:hypothetical protein